MYVWFVIWGMYSGMQPHIIYIPPVPSRSYLLPWEILTRPVENPELQLNALSPYFAVVLPRSINRYLQLPIKSTLLSRGPPSPYPHRYPCADQCLGQDSWRIPPVASGDKFYSMSTLYTYNAELPGSNPLPQFAFSCFSSLSFTVGYTLPPMLYNSCIVS